MSISILSSHNAFALLFFCIRCLVLLRFLNSIEMDIAIFTVSLCRNIRWMQTTQNSLTKLNKSSAYATDDSRQKARYWDILSRWTDRMLIEYVIHMHSVVSFGDCWWTTITCYMQSSISVGHEISKTRWNRLHGQWAWLSNSLKVFQIHLFFHLISVSWSWVTIYTEYAISIYRWTRCFIMFSQVLISNYDLAHSFTQPVI